jgi:DNA mismatch repair ATPase MutS
MQLQKQNAFGIVSTHDVELGDELDNEAFIQNYSFYSDVINGQLSFDYQLRKGVCHSFNASQLMQQIGIEMG